MACKYEVVKKDISDRIIVSNVNQIYDGFDKEITAYVSGRIASVKVEYFLDNVWTSNRFPVEVGEHKYRVSVQSDSYTGTVEGELSIVKQVKYVFHDVDGNELGATKYSGIGRYIELPKYELSLEANEYATYMWYYVDRNGVDTPFKATLKLSEEMCVEEDGILVLRLYIAVLKVKLTPNSSLELSDIITLSGNETDGSFNTTIFGLVTVDIYNMTNKNVGRLTFDRSVEPTIASKLKPGNYEASYNLLITITVGKISQTLSSGSNDYIKLSF